MAAIYPKGALYMVTELKKLTNNDGYDIYEMLQDIPAEENGFYNNQNGAA